MKWSQEASDAISKVPFFVRKRVRRRVEEEADRRGAREVRVEHVRASQRRFLEQMEDEVKGYQVETCFGPSGCPNRAVICDGLIRELEARLSQRKLKAFLKERVVGPLKLHHEFRISVSDCPNACSRPQIVDVGLIGACRPRISGKECSRCEACVEVCKEDAIRLKTDGDAPLVDYNRCLSCGKCAKVCPTGCLEEDVKGYRILLGGKLGRHPRLGQELPGIYGEREALSIIDRCLDYFQRHCTSGERFGEIMEKAGSDELLATIEDAARKRTPSSP